MLEILYSQARISRKMRGSHSLGKLNRQLDYKGDHPRKQDWLMLDAVRFNGKKMSSDNRRLYLLKQHQIQIIYEVVARVRLSAEVNGDLSGTLVHVNQQNRADNERHRHLYPQSTTNSVATGRGFCTGLLKVWSML